jgi:hypothetical protein
METSPKLNFRNLKENPSQVIKKKEAGMEKKILKVMLVFSLLFSSILPPQQSANAAVSSSVKSQIRTLFYGSQQAFLKSTAAGIAYIESHNYPGSVKTSSSLYKSSKQKRINAGFKYLMTPQLSTIDKDPTWMWSGALCHPQMKKPPKGDTYIVTINWTMVPLGTNGTSDVHVTILNKKAYFYFDICISE